MNSIIQPTALRRIIALSSLSIARPTSSSAQAACFKRWFSPQRTVAAPASGKRDNVVVIGSGNWGSVAAKIVGYNVLRQPQRFDPEVRMWVYEEQHHAPDEHVHKAFDALDIDRSGVINEDKLRQVALEVGVTLTHDEAVAILNQLDRNHKGEVQYKQFAEWWSHKGRSRYSVKLSELIARTNENVKYLPGIKLGPNVRAVTDLAKVVQGATVLVFVTPHQFVSGVIKQMQPHLLPANQLKAISLVKGMEVEQHGFHLISQVVAKSLGVECSVLMGANLAHEVGLERFSEATVGHRSQEHARLFVDLFNTPFFHVQAVQDVEGVELCGTLKNIVAIGAGFVDGLRMGNNSKAAIIRVGLMEMKKLAQMLYPTVKDATFFESAGVADLITTCFGGRNRKCAEAFVEARGQKSWANIEAELLNGQKLQGVLTSHEVQEVLRHKGWEHHFPLFTTINRVIKGDIDPHRVVEFATRP